MSVSPSELHDALANQARETAMLQKTLDAQVAAVHAELLAEVATLRAEVVAAFEVTERYQTNARLHRAVETIKKEGEVR